MIKKWRNIKDGYVKNLRKKTKSGQAADSGRRYVYARQLSFLKTAGATTETQSSLDGNGEEENVRQLDDQPGENEPQRYDQNPPRKRKHDLETTLINFMKSPIPSVAAVPEPSSDRSFFESIIPSIKDFTEDQKLELRSEIINIVKRMRMSSCPQNYVYPTNFPHPTTFNVPCLPYPHSSNYLPQSDQSSPQLQPIPHASKFYPEAKSHQYPQVASTSASSYLPSNLPEQSSTQTAVNKKHPYSQTQISGLNNSNPISPNSSHTSVDNQSYTEEDMDLFKD